MTAPRLLILCGSLRRGSLNAAVAAAITTAVGGRAIVETTALPAMLPFYDPDLEIDPPQAALEWREQLAACDLLLIVSPEYNYSVPALVKNAIDWGSRPPGEAVLAGKRVALTGAATGRGGTVRGQLALRHILLSAECHVMGAPELALTIPHGVDEAATHRIAEFTDEVVHFAHSRDL